MFVMKEIIFLIFLIELCCRFVACYQDPRAFAKHGITDHVDSHASTKSNDMNAPRFSRNSEGRFVIDPHWTSGDGLYFDQSSTDLTQSYDEPVDSFEKELFDPYKKYNEKGYTDPSGSGRNLRPNRELFVPYTKNITYSTDPENKYIYEVEEVVYFSDPEYYEREFEHLSSVEQPGDEDFDDSFDDGYVREMTDYPPNSATSGTAVESDQDWQPVYNDLTDSQEYHREPYYAHSETKFDGWKNEPREQYENIPYEHSNKYNDDLRKFRNPDGGKWGLERRSDFGIANIPYDYSSTRNNDFRTFRNPDGGVRGVEGSDFVFKNFKTDEPYNVRRKIIYKGPPENLHYYRFDKPNGKIFSAGSENDDDAKIPMRYSSFPYKVNPQIAVSENEYGLHKNYESKDEASIVKRHLVNPQFRYPPEYDSIVADRPTREGRASIGGINYVNSQYGYRSDYDNDLIRSRRSIKPISSDQSLRLGGPMGFIRGRSLESPLVPDDQDEFLKNIEEGGHDDPSKPIASDESTVQLDGDLTNFIEEAEEGEALGESSSARDPEDASNESARVTSEDQPAIGNESEGEREASGENALPTDVNLWKPEHLSVSFDKSPSESQESGKDDPPSFKIVVGNHTADGDEIYTIENSEERADESQIAIPPNPEKSVELSTTIPPSSEENIDESATMLPPSSEENADESPIAIPPNPEESVESPTTIPPSSEENIEESTTTLPPSSEENADESSIAIPPNSEESVESSTTIPPSSEQNVDESQTAIPSSQEKNADESPTVTSSPIDVIYHTWPKHNRRGNKVHSLIDSRPTHFTRDRQRDESQIEIPPPIDDSQGGSQSRRPLLIEDEWSKNDRLGDSQTKILPPIDDSQGGSQSRRPPLIDDKWSKNDRLGDSQTEIPPPIDDSNLMWPEGHHQQWDNENSSDADEDTSDDDDENADDEDGIKTSKIYESGFHVPNANFCPNEGEDLKLLIIVDSLSESFRERMAIRETWKSYTNDVYVKLVFIVGVQEDSNDTLVYEIEVFNDIIQSQNADVYIRHSSLKFLSAIEWIITFCRLVPFVAKADEAIFINVPKLLTIVDEYAIGDTAIFGRIVNDSYRISDKSYLYHVSERAFPDDMYPAYPWGRFYLIRKPPLQDFYNTALSLPYVPLDDVWFSGVIADGIGVPRINIDNFINDCGVLDDIQPEDLDDYVAFCLPDSNEVRGLMQQFIMD